MLVLREVACQRLFTNTNGGHHDPPSFRERRHPCLPILFDCSLRLAGSRRFRQQHLQRLSRFRTFVLLQFVNPIGYGLNHFACGLARACCFWSLSRLTIALTLLDDFDSLLPWHDCYPCIYSFFRVLYLTIFGLKSSHFVETHW